MNKLIPLKQISQLPRKLSFLRQAFVVSDKDKKPVGFVFGRDAFIRLLEVIDEEFEDKVPDPQKAHENPAGQLIDSIEEQLLVNPKTVSELKKTVEKTDNVGWIPLDDIVTKMHV